MRNTFCGYYFKHQNSEHTVAFIPGTANDKAFIQVITEESSYNFDFDSADFGEKIIIGDNSFSENGISISLPDINGTINYSCLSPIRTDIMGPFKFFSMECRHKVVSMRHLLNGNLKIGNRYYDFSQGIGYIEGDSGKSFPKRYIWVQANDFQDNSSFMFSLAEIPFLKLHFQGLISVIMHNGIEYRLATYYGAKFCISDNNITVTQGKMCLTINILDSGNGYSLASPVNGKMKGIIKENNNAVVEIKLWVSGKNIYHQISSHAGLEISGYNLNL